jgi:hypothetical protein
MSWVRNTDRARKKSTYSTSSHGAKMTTHSMSIQRKAQFSIILCKSSVVPVSYSVSGIVVLQSCSPAVALRSKLDSI